MKEILTKMFSPILNRLENQQGSEVYIYSPSHRKILAVMGVLFIIIASVALYFSMQINQMAGLFPVILFAGIGLLCLVVAGLGSDRAVAKLWRNRD